MMNGFWHTKGVDATFSHLGSHDPLSPKKERERERNREKKTLMHTAKVRMQTQTRSELPGLLICSRSATLTTHRTNTHTHSDLSTENDLLILGSTH
jgi:hypothetical protein